MVGDVVIVMTVGTVAHVMKINAMPVVNMVSG